MKSKSLPRPTVALTRPTMEDTLATQKHEGRLELTWTNKDKRLLADEDGNYEWVSPADYRVAEVRLLDDAGEVGEVGPRTKRAADNLLIRGDALNALTSLTELPEFASEYVGKVKLAYLAAVQYAAIVLAVRRRTGTLGLADDDARPLGPGQEAPVGGWLSLGPLR